MPKKPSHPTTWGYCLHTHTIFTDGAHTCISKALFDLEVLDFLSSFWGNLWPLPLKRKIFDAGYTTIMSSPEMCTQWDWDESAGKWASIFLAVKGRR